MPRFGSSTALRPFNEKQFFDASPGAAPAGGKPKMPSRRRWQGPKPAHCGTPSSEAPALQVTPVPTSPTGYVRWLKGTCVKLGLNHQYSTFEQTQTTTDDYFSLLEPLNELLDSVATRSADLRSSALRLRVVSEQFLRCIEVVTAPLSDHNLFEGSFTVSMAAVV